MGSLAPGLHLQKSPLLEAFWENRPSSFEGQSPQPLCSRGNPGPHSSSHLGTGIGRSEGHIVTEPPTSGQSHSGAALSPSPTSSDSHSDPT